MFLLDNYHHEWTNLTAPARNNVWTTNEFPCAHAICRHVWLRRSRTFKLQLLLINAYDNRWLSIVIIRNLITYILLVRMHHGHESMQYERLSNLSMFEHRYQPLAKVANAYTYWQINKSRINRNYNRYCNIRILLLNCRHVLPNATV
jgi:hypothetical protein